MTITRTPGLIVVVGGGVTGLAAAWAAATRTPGAMRVVLLEAESRLGGRITTIDVDGVAVDVGPEALVTYQPGVMDACEQLGLGDELVAPAVNETRVYARGALRALPERLMEGAPGGAVSVARTGILSTRGLLRAGLDLVLPRTKVTEMSSIGELVQARLGREVAQRMVDPLLGGVHAGSIWHLDAHLLAPQVTGALATHRSLVRGMRHHAARRRVQSNASTSGAAPASPFRTLRGGLRTLTAALERACRDAGVDIRTSAEVMRIRPDGRITLADETTLNADAIILASPAPAAARLVAKAAPGCTALMHQIRWASTATCLLRLPATEIGRLAGLSGVLIPRGEGVHIKAITCVSEKWGHELLDGDVLLKCYLGHAGDDAPVTDLDDSAIVSRTLQSLKRIAGIDAMASWSHVTRFRDGIPQYEPGHATRVADIEAQLHNAFDGRLHLAGASWHGSGLGSCLADGTRAAHAALTQLSHEVRVEHELRDTILPATRTTTTGGD